MMFDASSGPSVVPTTIAVSATNEDSSQAGVAGERVPDGAARAVAPRGRAELERRVAQERIAVRMSPAGVVGDVLARTSKPPPDASLSSKACMNEPDVAVPVTSVNPTSVKVASVTPLRKRSASGYDVAKRQDADAPGYVPATDPACFDHRGHRECCPGVVSEPRSARNGGAE